MIKKKDVYKNINLNIVNVKAKEEYLEKKKNEINRGEYVYSLIEFRDDKSKFNLIKEEMEMPEYLQSNERRLKNSGFGPKLNIHNFKQFTKNISLNPELQTMNFLLSKMEKKNQIHKLDTKKKKIIKTKPFCLGPERRAQIRTESTVYPAHSFDDENRNTRLSTFYNQSFYRNTLNQSLYKIVDRVQSIKDTCEANCIAKYTSKSSEQKINLRKKPKQGEYSFPIINKTILGNVHKNVFREVKEDLYKKFLEKRRKFARGLSIISHRKEDDDDE